MSRGVGVLRASQSTLRSNRNGRSLTPFVKVRAGSRAPHQTRPRRLLIVFSRILICSKPEPHRVLFSEMLGISYPPATPVEPDCNQRTRKWSLQGFLWVLTGNISYQVLCGGLFWSILSNLAVRPRVSSAQSNMRAKKIVCPNPWQCPSAPSAALNTTKVLAQISRS